MIFPSTWKLLINYIDGVLAGILICYSVAVDRQFVYVVIPMVIFDAMYFLWRLRAERELQRLHEQSLRMMREHLQ